jgi:hypothetical protein
MDRNNKTKFDLLGEPIGTATAKLRKTILFKLIQETNKDICFQCGERIESVDDLSIEHKVPWQSSNNPKQAFYDLDNISFSHLHCNIQSANRHVPHPTVRGENHGMAVLDNDTVLKIKDDLESGMRNKDLVEKYGLDKRRISSIKTGNIWKYTK